MYYLSIKTSSPQITTALQICLGTQLGLNPHGTKALFQRGVIVAVGSWVFVCPDVASWSYESTERLHWLHPAGGSSTAKGTWDSFSNPSPQCSTPNQRAPSPFCGGGEWTTEGRSDGSRERMKTPPSCHCPVCAASHTSQLISGQIHTPLISGTC